MRCEKRADSWSVSDWEEVFINIEASLCTAKSGDTDVQLNWPTVLPVYWS
jgi:hypothetical protein